MDPAFHLSPRQRDLTPELEAAVAAFAESSLRERLSTAPVDEQEAKALLGQAYQVRGLPAPQRIHWVDGPLQLVMLLASPKGEDDSVARFRDVILASIQDTIDTSGVGIDHDRYWSLGEPVIVDGSWLRLIASVEASVRSSVGDPIWEYVQKELAANIERTLDSLVEFLGNMVETNSYWAEDWRPRWRLAHAGMQAYFETPELAVYRFFATYLAPNDLQAFARFNEMVSGYWLSKDVALIVRCPRLLSLDDQGRLHSATGKVLEYADGWGCFAWHGVEVPERVIVASETLTREDWRSAWNVEVRRVIQERMGERFVSELGGVVLDAGPHGVLYTVDLEDDPEGSARYVRVRDPSTAREYYLRVPPAIQTASEAVAWSFGRTIDEYHPAQET